MSGNLSGPNRGVGIGRFKRALIIAAWGGRCWVCGSKPHRLSLDHVIPRQDGGQANVENLRPACPGCNVKRDRRLKKLSGRARRDAIALDTANTWHQAFPLPVFDDSGQLVELHPGLEASLRDDPHLRRRSYGRVKEPEPAAA